MDTTDLAVRLVELRVLDGPNLYFNRPAIKLTIGVGPWLALPERRAEQLAGHAGFRRSSRAGAPGGEQRLRFVARVAADLTRSFARATETRLAVRGRPGPQGDQIVIAYPWRRQHSAEAFGQQIPALLEATLDGRRSIERAIAEAAARSAVDDVGPSPSVVVPSVPVIAVTGTNGKTTTVRLITHLARAAGWSVACTTTDGVYHDEVLVEEGDYSGFSGASKALACPGINLGVLETARGGILLRGIGTTHNDVAVVTNVTADHLDQYGIRTLDQLAEVKATITHITRPQGWDILNADDPRVLAMRRHVTGQPWVFSLDADHPAIRGTLAERGRATTVLDGRLVVMSSRHDAHPLLPIEDIPATIGGVSSHNLRNVMAATSAALGVGVPESAVISGLRSFVLNPERDPGRANLFELDGRVIVVDYAHNEDGMIGLVEICRGLRQAGASVWLTFGSAGDRTNTILHRLGYAAARGADRVAIAELHRYLRGRDPQELVRRLREGAIDGGKSEVPSFASEMEALRWMLSQSAPGDVLAVTALAQRPEIFAYMREHRGVALGPERVRELVLRARNHPAVHC